jgi:hypothetical protein
MLKNPLFANRRDLEACLTALGKRPLKIIANSLYDDELDWKDAKWNFKKDTNGRIRKALLVNRKDSFQLSVANEKSKQDYHIHNSTLEIYISDFPMKLFTSGARTTVIDTCGLLIVPPKIEHKVELHGFAYVLQIKQGKVPIDKDKKII